MIPEFVVDTSLPLSSRDHLQCSLSSPFPRAFLRALTDRLSIPALRLPPSASRAGARILLALLFRVAVLRFTHSAPVDTCTVLTIMPEPSTPVPTISCPPSYGVALEHGQRVHTTQPAHQPTRRPTTHQLRIMRTCTTNAAPTPLSTPLTPNSRAPQLRYVWTHNTPSTEGNEHIFTCIDTESRYLVTYYIRKRQEVNAIIPQMFHTLAQQDKLPPAYPTVVLCACQAGTRIQRSSSNTNNNNQQELPYGVSDSPFPFKWVCGPQ